MSLAADTLRLTGLDTLSERALRRLTDRWTGELHPMHTDSLGRVEPTEHPSEAVSAEVFDRIIGQWRLAREKYQDAPLESLYGSRSSLAEGVMRLDSEPAVELQEVGSEITSVTTDSLSVAADSLSVAADSLSVAAKPIAAADPAPVNDVAETMLTPVWWDLAEWTILLYSLLVVVLLFLYIRSLYRYFDDIATLFGSVFGRSTTPTGCTGERRRSDIFYGSLGKLFMLGAGFVGLLAGIVCLRAEIAMAADVQLFMPFVAMALFLLVVTLQYGMLSVVGAVTRSTAEVASLMHIRLVYFVLATVMVAPVMLMALMGSAAAYDLWFKVATVGAGVVVILFIRESIKFFIHKKVSILHWFLYLCTVEILPFSLLWQAAKILR